jgi:hypothetical protein
VRQNKLKIWVELAQACKPKGREDFLAELFEGYF